MAPLTREEILQAAEEVLRRYGPAKTNVVDVARALNVSHGSVYRHFPSKAALREAVARRFLETTSDPLEQIDDPKQWFKTLMATKRAKAVEDPELFATYVALARESGDAVKDHVDHLIAQLTNIVGDETTARALFDATARWHDPARRGVVQAGNRRSVRGGLGATGSGDRPAGKVGLSGPTDCLGDGATGNVGLSGPTDCLGDGATGMSALVGRRTA